METNDELKQEKRMVEVRKANPGKYTVVLPDGRIKYNDMQLLRDTEKK